MQEIIIRETEQGQRLDKFLLKYLNTAPKSFVYKMLRKKNIKVNDKKAEGSEVLQVGDNVKLFLSDETINNFREIAEVDVTVKSIEIVFEDENILIMNKPVGALVHPDESTKTDTMTERMYKYLYNKGEYDPKESMGFKPAICNRLDINTSGIIVCGKNLQSVQELNYIFKEKLVDKYYVTLVKGEVSKSGVIKGYHTKNTTTNEVKVSLHKTPNSKEVITEYMPMKSNGEYSLLTLKLITGKSHQIRASLKEIKRPIVGDRKYGDKEVNEFFRKKYGISNQMLHAESIAFMNKEGCLAYLYDKEFVAKRPRKFDTVCDSLFG